MIRDTEKTYHKSLLLIRTSLVTAFGILLHMYIKLLDLTSIHTKNHIFHLLHIQDNISTYFIVIFNFSIDFSLKNRVLDFSIFSSSIV